jgi:hypothetical protein
MSAAALKASAKTVARAVMAPLAPALLVMANVVARVAKVLAAPAVMIVAMTAVVASAPTGVLVNGPKNLHPSNQW